VRDDLPFGNSIIDTAEHYTASAPRKGALGLRRLPSINPEWHTMITWLI
jgi:hypothetical protein